MSYLKWAIAGLVGAAVGGFVWFLVTYYTNYEVGYIAVLVGFLAGVGVRMAAGDHEVGTGPAMAALVAAMFGIAGAKYAVTRVMVNQLMAPQVARALADPSEEQRMVEFSKSIVLERELAGKQVTWPAGKELITAKVESDFPADVWAEAKQRIVAETPEQRQLALRDRRKAMEQGAQQARQILVQDRFLQSFGMYDLLWFGLAGMAAWRAGSGLASNDE